MSFYIEVKNSFCHLKGNIPTETESLIKELLTYQNDIGAERAQIFNQMSYAKNRGLDKMYKACVGKLKKLEKNEWVCWYNDKSFPTGHLKLVEDLLNAAKIPYKLNDLRVKPDSTHVFRWKNKPPPARYYQKEMIDNFLELHRGVIVSAVGSGKTNVVVNIIKQLGVKTLVVVPSRGLLSQFTEVLKFHFDSKHIDMLDASKIRNKAKLKPIRVITIQSLAALNKSGELNKLIEDIDFISFDEFHHSSAKSYTDLLPKIDHIYYRLGQTGTFLRNGNDVLDMWGILSVRLYNYSAFQAIKDGYLTPLKINVYNMPGIPNKNYQKEYSNHYCGNKFVLEKINKIIDKVNPEDQILILVARKEKSGDVLHKYLKKLGIKNSYVSGDDKKEVINQAIEDFNDKKINILIGSSVLGEGIDIRSTNHLIMLQGGKSEIVMVQAIGRCVRLFEGKELAEVHDFNFLNTNYMEKHFNIRLDIYKRNFEPEEIEVFDE